MKITKLLYSVFLFCFTLHTVKAQRPISKTDSSIIGVWNGTSICQAKNSPCHDEIVVYRISKGQGADTFNISASKIVNGKEVDMGAIPFKFDKTTNRLTSASSTGLWTLTLRGRDLDGTLTFHGDLYRLIKLSKQN
ncbi:MAG TPA: hypothetical protein VFP87_07970 [Chitinophagaceae bacterium]|nr:hypothetical protein [Chitinophagaceae bacterium]